MAPDGAVLAECVVNVSEGRDLGVIDSLVVAGGAQVIDVHTDAVHHRSVLTLAGVLPEVEAAVRQVAATATASIDLSDHRGVHPRFGAVDVVPFVPLAGDDGAATGWADVVAARDAYARWSASVLGVPCFLYGTGRTLPEVRRAAFTSMAPDTGASRPHPTAGATAVGVRDVLIAYNVWLTADDDSGEPGDVVAVARRLAGQLRRPGLRTLGLPLDGIAQVSCNVVDPTSVDLAQVYDAVAAGASANRCTVLRGELVGLLPRSALRAVPRARWASLGLREEDTIEHRIGARQG